MHVNYVSRIRIRNVELGHGKLADGTVIVLRVAIVDVRPIRVGSPFGVEFEVSFTTGISAYPSQKVLEDFKDKQVLMLGENLPDSWQQLGIVDKKSAVEEVEFNDEKLGKYIIRVEIEPLMAAVNTEKKSIKGEPIYAVRWAPKISWRKINGD